MLKSFFSSFQLQNNTTLQPKLEFGTLKLPLAEREVIPLAALLEGGEAACKTMMSHLAADGFFTIDPANTLHARVGKEAHDLGDAFVKHEAALIAIPELKAPSPVAGGLSQYFQVEVVSGRIKLLGQLITAIVQKPMQQEKYEQLREPLPPVAQELIQGLSDVYDRHVYGLLHDVFRAIAKQYHVEDSVLKSLVLKQNGGAVRLIHYGSPAPLTLAENSSFLSMEPTHALGVKGIPAHTDASLLTGNLGETSSGLTHVDEKGDLTLIPSNPAHVIVTVGDMLANLSRDTPTPLPPFKHTVYGGERVVTVGFYSPDYDATMHTWGNHTPLGTTAEHYQQHLPEVEEAK